MRRAVLVSAMVSMALVLAGCKQKTDTAAAPAPPTPVVARNTAPAADKTVAANKDGCTDCATKPGDTKTGGATGTTAEAGNKTCPVMKGRAVNPDLFVEYKGKKIYVCCRKCLAEVQAHPEKYADASS
ncbi:MAG: hypothetical protein HZB16_13655 [Armatimonadetes bacterium]|nr:hypothetical protein [Armatimonadota bacterium]